MRDRIEKRERTSPRTQSGGRATIVVALLCCCVLFATTFQILPSLVAPLSSSKDLLEKGIFPSFENTKASQEAVQKSLDGISQQLRVISKKLDFFGPIHMSLKTATESKRKYAPFDCAKYENERKLLPKKNEEATKTLKATAAYTGLLVDDPNKAAIHARWTRTSPSFWVSLSSKMYDAVRYQIMSEGVYYELKLTSVFQDILRSSPPNSLVLDVGSNIGWFSLLSRSLGHSVYIFDANPIHMLRICESIELNRWNERDAALEAASLSFEEHLAYMQHRPVIQPYNYGVSDKEGELEFSIPKNAPGSASFGIPEKQKSAKDYFTRRTIPLLTLDQFAEDHGLVLDTTTAIAGGTSGSSKPTSMAKSIAILKIDVESWEDHVIHGARQLLASGIVENILMEFSYNTDDTQDVVLERLTKTCAALSDASYYLYQWGYWSGPGNQVDDKDLSTLDYLKAKCLDARRSCNLWWKRNSTLETS